MYKYNNKMVFIRQIEASVYIIFLKQNEIYVLLLWI